MPLPIPFHRRTPPRDEALPAREGAPVPQRIERPTFKAPPLQVEAPIGDVLEFAAELRERTLGSR